MKVNRLDNPEVLNLIDDNKINKIFLDIDYTVLDFEKGHIAGVKSLNEIYKNLGERIDHIFKVVLEGKRNLENLNDKEKEEYKNFMKDFSEIQNNFLEKNQSIKYWSRETMIMEAAKDLKIKFNDDKEIQKLSQIYWQAVAEKSEYYDDAIPFLDKIKKLKIPIVWVTGSDSVLVVKKNGERMELDYDPKYSWEEKEKRLQKLLNDYPGELIIGDPIEKPEIWHDLLKGIEIEKTLVIGDSYLADLKVADELGIKIILIKR